MGNVHSRKFNFFREFIKLESSSTALLLTATAIALLLANSPWQKYYTLTLHYSLAGANLYYVINDGLMAIFFLLVSLEIKRELIEGELNSRSKALLPVIAAIGGMIVPALIYLVFNITDPINLQGWAIPCATDIAFSLAILTLLSKQIPPSLKVFLTALAIIDDLGAIIIIALFYTHHINLIFLLLAALCLAALLFLNFRDYQKIGLYGLIGLLLWIFILKSGIQATIAGVILGLTVPLSSAKKLEHKLHPWVAFGILPLFALTNAGLSLLGMHWSTLLNPIPLGIVLGLFLGKQLGVFSVSWLAIKTGVAKLPTQTNWRQMYAISVLCGIGFTMSLFIGTLAFADTAELYAMLVRLGVLIGSLLSAFIGYLLLRTGSYPNIQ